MRPAFIEGPHGDRETAYPYTQAATRFIYQWGWSPYEAPFVGLAVSGAARAKALAAADAWAVVSDLVVFPVDLGWTENMVRRLRMTWAEGRSWPLREVLFLSRLRPDGDFVVTSPTVDEVAKLLGWKRGAA